jgi:multidrug efflux pump subunit AcrA (membrane-fusion protein)
VKEGDLLATLDTAALELELQSAQQEVPCGKPRSMR